MELLDFINFTQEYYREKIKPAFQSKNLSRARLGVMNLKFQLETKENDFFIYHHGINCKLALEKIQDDLLNGILPSESLATEFESYLAQLKLSITSRNIG